MPTFDEKIQDHLDKRIATLGKIKFRSIGADNLTLTAMHVLVYAQLEGGIKDLAGCVLHDLNARRPPFGNIKPELLRWRNPDEIVRLKSLVDFSMIAMPSPFSCALSRRFRVNGINRRKELNQMSWEAIKRVYIGLGLDYSDVQKVKSKIDDIVDGRNQAAHHGVLPSISAIQMETHVRQNVAIVENVLIDFSLQVLPFFSAGMHLR